jgi:hypothetical protein
MGHQYQKKSGLGINKPTKNGRFNIRYEIYHSGFSSVWVIVGDFTTQPKTPDELPDWSFGRSAKVTERQGISTHRSFGLSNFWGLDHLSHQLVAGSEHYLFFHMLGIVIPTD